MPAHAAHASADMYSQHNTVRRTRGLPELHQYHLRKFNAMRVEWYEWSVLSET